MERNKFLRGALLLTLSGLICKALGAVYRIPLGNTIGTEGMGYYQMAYPVYSMLIMLSSAGIPIALSRMVSETCARGDEAGANEIFWVSRRVLLWLGIASGAVMFAGSDIIARVQGLPGTALSLRMLAPSLVCVALVSAYRGVLQGRQLMGATAVSQVTEQLVRLTLGLYLAGLWMPKGAEAGAGGALLGVTLSELAGLAVVAGYYAAKRREFRDMGGKVEKDRRRKILKELLRVALPITAGACATTLVGTIDSAMVMRVLTGNGYGTREATGLFGLLTGFVQPIINMPAVLSGAVAMSIVPAISAACAVGNNRKMKIQADLAYKLGILLGLPCAVGLTLLAEPVLGAIYPTLKGAELSRAAAMMRVMAPGILLMSVSQVSTGILQGVGRMIHPVCSMILGAMVKLFLGIWLIRIPSLNIMGAAWGTLLYFGVNAVVDTLLAVRYAGVKIGFRDTLPRGLISAGIMGGVVYICYFLLHTGVWIAVLAGAVSYAILLIVTGALDAGDLSRIPMGGRVTKLMIRMKIRRKA